MQIFIIQAIHFAQPFRPLEVHATLASANASAAKLTNDLRDWEELPQDATSEDWKTKLLEVRLKRAEDFGIEVDEDSLDEDELGRALGEDNGDVWIIETELHGVPSSPRDWFVWLREQANQDGAIPADRFPYIARYIRAVHGTSTVEEERAAFEAWAAKEWTNGKPPHSAWIGWQGRAGIGKPVAMAKVC